MHDGVLEWRVPVGEEETTAIYEPATGARGDTVFVCAHGAGGHMHDRSMKSLSAALRARGIALVRFNFLYREKGSRRPDAMPRLRECMTAVIEHARAVAAPGTLLIGGRSMGGRAASMMAADGYACDGLILLAYPLHPAGKPETLRDAHLARITIPVLCISGTRDALCRRDLMSRTLAPLGPHWHMHWLEAADHAFRVPRSSGRSDADVIDESAAVTARWLSRAVRPATACDE